LKDDDDRDGACVLVRFFFLIIVWEFRD
jgi:hypothetical protein